MAKSALLFALFAAGSLLAQKNDSETPQRLVLLDVVATDAHSDAVTNLTADDIRVREDGKLRPVVFFRYEGARHGNPPPGETVNRPPVPPTLILFDRWNEQMMTAATAWGDVGTALQRLESVESLYIYFLTNQGNLYMVHPLPATDADLRAMTQPTPAQLRGELDDAVRKLSGFRNMDAYDPVIRANTTLKALAVLGTQMASIPGRKNLIWVTHGFPLTVRLPGNQWLDFTQQIHRIGWATTTSQIAIYTVDESQQGAGADIAGLGRETLQMFASVTGGRWYPSGNADQAISGAMTDSRGAYRLAYFSPFREKDKKEHKIHLDSPEKGVRLVTREGYFGDEPDPDPNVVEAAAFSNERRSPFDGSEIGLRVEMAREGKNARFVIHVNAADLLLLKRDAKYEATVGVMLAVYQNGFLKGATPLKNLDLTLTPEQYQQALKEGVMFNEVAPLDEQSEKVRVMVYDPALQALGSVTMAAK